MRTAKAIARLEREVKRVLNECHLTGPKLLVVAVSGGPDSLALLFALNRLRGEIDFKLHGAHLDHGMRGAASEADARFVADIFRRLGIGLTSERADVPSFRKRHRLSPEQAAREVRHAFLGRVASEQRADAIALAHTSDDQAETVLMHIIRGSALTGLRGMEPSVRRTFGGSEFMLVRPLLRLSKEDTADYCRELSLEPRMDESNLSTELRRNRVRMQLLPLLEEFNPSIREALIRLSRSAAQEVDYLDSQVESIWYDAARQEEGYVLLKKDIFRELSPALQGHLLRRAVSKVKGDLNEIEQNHIEDMARLIGGPGGRTLALPQGVRLYVGYTEATVAPSESDLPSPLPILEGEHPLKIPGETQIGDWRVKANVVERTPQESTVGPSANVGALLREEMHEGGRPADNSRASEHGPDGLKAHLSADVLGSQLRIRARRPGDRFQPLGMSQQKRLQDFMVDAKIPRHWRDRVPLVVSSEGIVWVAGWRIADWARVKKDETRQLELSLLPQGW